MTDVVSAPDFGYPDNGCAQNPVPRGCVNCPFPVCFYDDPNAFTSRSLKSSIKRQEIVRLARQGTHYLEIAEQMGVTGRSVVRYLAKHKAHPEMMA